MSGQTVNVNASPTRAPSRYRGASVQLLLITLAIALTGYIRELVLAKLFGANMAMDAYYFAFGLVQAGHDLLFAGVLGATIVPLLHGSVAPRGENADSRSRFIVTLVVVVAGVACVAALTIWAALPQIVATAAPRMTSETQTMLNEFMSILIWLLPANALTTLFVLILNAYGRFLLAACAYLANNIIFVMLTVLMAPVLGPRITPFATLAGPLTVIPVLMIQLARMGVFRPARPVMDRQSFDPFWRLSRSILVSFGIGSTSGLLMTSHFLIRVYGANYQEGAVAALGYAFRLYEVPLSLIANPAAILILPAVSGLYAAGRLGEISAISRRTLLVGLIVLFPAAVVTWQGADIIVSVLLQRGNFDANAARLTATALRGFAPAVIAEAVFVVFFRVFYALHRSDRTVIVAFVSLASLLGSLWMVGESGFLALPLALSASFAAAAVVIVGFLMHDIGSAAVPSPRALGRWLACAVCALFVDELSRAAIGIGQTGELLGLVSFLAAYTAAAFTLFPDLRADMVGLLHDAWPAARGRPK